MNLSLSTVAQSSVWNRAKIFCLVLGTVALAGCQQSMTNSDKLTRTLSVSGQAIVPISVTMAQVNLGVEVQGKTAEEVQKEIAQKSSAVVDLLKSQNVEKLQTTGIRLNPIYSYKDGEQSISGYSGTNTVSFRIDSEKSGSLLDDAIAAGATRIDGINFVASDSAIAQAQKEALRQAAEDAKEQAGAVLEALSLSQREVVSIQLNNSNAPMPPMYPMPMMAQVQENKAATTAVVAGEQQVQASVTLQIRY